MNRPATVLAAAALAVTVLAAPAAAKGYPVRHVGNADYLYGSHCTDTAQNGPYELVQVTNDGNPRRFVLLWEFADGTSESVNLGVIPTGQSNLDIVYRRRPVTFYIGPQTSPYAVTDTITPAGGCS